MRSVFVPSVLLVLIGCASVRTAEVARVHAHLTRVEHELRLSTPSSLTPAQREGREQVLQLLRRYAEAEQYPINTVSTSMTPIFVDPEGRRCAMAAILEGTGSTTLVARVAGQNNLAYVEELAADPELSAWLEAHGLSVVEAARVQPTYASVRSDWQFAVAAFGSAQVGTGTTLSPGVRLGARHRDWVPRGAACDHCVDESWALLAEYRRDFVLGTQSINTLSVLWQYEFNGHLQPGNFELTMGPLVSVGDQGQLGALGAQLAGGYAFHHWPVPLFVEVVVGAGGGAGLVARGGVNVGVAW